MNRIYQGRVSTVEILKPGTRGRTAEYEPLSADAKEARAAGENLLWEHHRLFQDAVNYYLLCLAALADPTDGLNPVSKLRERMVKDGTWERFPRPALPGLPAPHSLRESVAPWIGLDPVSASLEDAFSAVAPVEAEARAAMNLAVLSLVTDLGGEGKIRDGSKTYHPFFCDPDTTANPPRGKVSLARAAGKKSIPAKLWDDLTMTDRASRGEAFDMGMFRKTKLSMMNVVAARQRLQKAAEAVGESSALPVRRRANWHQALKNRIKRLPDAKVAVPGFNAGGDGKRSADDINLFHAYLLFAHVNPSRWMVKVMRQYCGRPEQKAEATSGKKELQRAKKLSEKEAVEVRLKSLGDDPITIARGSRGYVFKTFTALDGWHPDVSNTVWSEFEFAAFAEALMTINQYGQKTAERETRRKEAEMKRDYMTWVTSKWNAKAASEEEEAAEPPARLEGDVRYGLLKAMMSDLGYEELNTRGLRELRERWERCFKKNAPEPDAQTLLSVCSEFQGKFGAEMGDPNLFRMLCRKLYWPLWRTYAEDESRRDEYAAELRADGRARDIFGAWRDLQETEEDIKRLADPIRFTPAEAVYSRRLHGLDKNQATHGKMSGKGRKAIRDASPCVEMDIACKQGGKIARRRVLISYTAPRLRRDGLAGNAGQWVQPMLAALQMPTPPQTGKLDCAVELMPDYTRSGERRVLINFQADLPEQAIKDFIGAEARWQVNLITSFKKGGGVDKHFGVFWEGMEKAPTDAAWWHTVDGFNWLACDLGQRDAAAFALLEANATGVFPLSGQGKPVPVWSLGNAGGKDWTAGLRNRGVLSLPGEDASVYDGRHGVEQRRVEFHGSAGRNCIESEVRSEYAEALKIAVALIDSDAAARDFVGAAWDERSFPEQNDALLRLMKRAQNRLRQLQSWSCDLFGLEPKSERVREAWADSLLPQDIKWREMLNDQDMDGLRNALSAAWRDLRDSLQRQMVLIADRILPMRGRRWSWEPHEIDPSWSQLRPQDEPANKKCWLRGQRGLSMSRIEQLTALRKRVQSLNRALHHQFGERPVLNELRGEGVPDPCPEIFEKIDAIKEQRVNQTAHMILAQALGVRTVERTPERLMQAMSLKWTLFAWRLAESARSKEGAVRIGKVMNWLSHRIRREEVRHSLHGIYEKFRQPVDFIVIEDLNRYKVSSQRSRKENGRLMKWCHSQVRDKLIMLCEPLGIPVIEVQPAWSSKFCAVTGQPGFRATEVHDGNETDFAWSKYLEKAAKEPGDKDAVSVAKVFKLLRAVNTHLLKDQQRRKPDQKNRSKFTLLLPRELGSHFVGIRDGGVRHADINAAINLGLTAVASPKAWHIHRRLRVEKKNDETIVSAKNKREKAAFPSDTVRPVKWMGAAPKDQVRQLFIDRHNVAKMGRALVDGVSSPLATGLGMWDEVKKLKWDRIIAVNEDRLEKWNKKHGTDFVLDEDRLP